MQIKIPKMIQVAVAAKYQMNPKVKKTKQFKELMMKWSDGTSHSMASTYKVVLTRSAEELNQFISELDKVLENYENGIY